MVPSSQRFRATPKLSRDRRAEAIGTQAVSRSHRIGFPNGLHRVTQRDRERRIIVLGLGATNQKLP